MSNVESTDNYINRLRGAVDLSESRDEELIEQVISEYGHLLNGFYFDWFQYDADSQNIRELLHIVIQRVRERVNVDLAVERERLEKEADEDEEDEEPLE